MTFSIISKYSVGVDIPILTGATACGKTALSLELAQYFPIEIISADAMMVYKGMDIGTAKPTPEELAAVPHHGIDLREVWQEYDVVQFVSDAQKAIENILSRGKIPLVVGGTGFYLQALLQGLPLAPKANPQIQAQIARELEKRGLEAVLHEISQLYPSEVPRLQKNPRRVVRALELYRTTGLFPSQYGYSTPEYRYQVFALGNDHLPERIVLRTRAMLDMGLVQEVQALLLKLPQNTVRRPTALQAIGYKEVLNALDSGELDTVHDRLVQATQHYAKRQHTWIRTQLKLTPEPQAVLGSRLQAYLEQFC